jgi:indolepyruvate ferredoxin oxidoreductase beta subunit
MAAVPVRSINIAIMALGGQGGGVMAEWSVKAGEMAGYRAQYTSVQGVAQRTGATVYYIELFPEAEIERRGKEPVLALMPVPGDVDVVVASELMEAGRAIMRGFVTPDRTTLIGSTHRVFAIDEKIAPADGRADSGTVLEGAGAAARAWIGFDMEATAREGGSVISAVMFGALAGSGALPIPRQIFESVIRESGVAVEANLQTFALGFDRAQGRSMPPPAQPAGAQFHLTPPEPIRPLLARIEAGLPFAAHAFAIEGLRRVIDYQDLAYGRLYLDRLSEVAAWDKTAGGSSHRHELVRQAARHLALWMTFEDTYRVADLKTRGSRFARFREEIGASECQIVAVSEFMHPRLAEVADSLPAWLGRRVAGWRWLEPLFARGRQVRTSSLRGFLLLSLLAMGKRWRRATLRFAREETAMLGWLERIRAAASGNYQLAVELVRCQKLVRGYGETHERGMANFTWIMAALETHPGLGAAKLRDLRKAAEADDKAEALGRALASLPD